MADGQEKLAEARKLLENLDPHGRGPTVGDAMAVLEVLTEAMEALPDWIWENRCCPPGDSCCMCD